MIATTTPSTSDRTALERQNVSRRLRLVLIASLILVAAGAGAWLLGIDGDAVRPAPRQDEDARQRLKSLGYLN